MVRRLLTGLLLLTATAAADADSHTAWVRSRLAALPTYKDDRDADGKAEQLDNVARAIASASKGAPLPPQQWAALMLTVGFHEAGFSMRIIAGQCRKHECDHGRAVGFGQVHANALNRADWARAAGDVEVQAKLTSDALKRAYWNCRRSGVEPIQATLSSYAGQRCGATWRGLDARLATFQRVLGGKGGAS
jgi:hypothetical protein